MLQNLSEPTILHVACHGDVSPGAVSTLWFPGDELTRYSALHYERVIRVSWSMCDIAFFNSYFGSYGEPFVGGPSLGLNEAISIVEVQKVIASLWPILDDIAKELSYMFYKSLIDINDYID